MTNHAIARQFALLADLLEIQDDNAFKIRAYRRAAEQIGGLTENLQTIAARGELESIPGIGKGIAGKIEELCAGGTMRELERARQLSPEGLIEILALPGFGPRKARTLHEKLGITSLDELEAAAREGRVAGVAGVGVRSDPDLLEKIAAYRRRSSRWPIGRALPFAQNLARSLAQGCGSPRVEIAGSVRRMCDTAANIDLLVQADDTEARGRVQSCLAEVGDLVEEGPERLRARGHGGPLVTLHLATAATFAHRLRWATGSAAHNEQLAARAADHGLRMDEHGVVTQAGEATPLAAEDEATVYAAFGLPLIPPELREGRGEIEAAAAGRLPQLLTAADFRGILHCHSTYSDGRASIATMAAAARDKGQQFIAMTDHSRSLGVAHGLDEERLRQQMAEIDALNAEMPDGFRILKGIECDILADGTLDLPEDLLRELDVVIGSVHSHFSQDLETMTARVVRALETRCVSVLAHPTGRILGGRDPYQIDLDRVIDAALATGTALEINADPSRLDLKDVHARQAHEAGVPISINTDAHVPETLDYLTYGVATARRAWLEPEDVINTWPLERLVEWLHRPRG